MIWILLPLHPVTAGWCFLEISCTKRRHVILESWNPCIPKNDHLERNMLNFIWCDHPIWVNKYFTSLKWSLIVRGCSPNFKPTSSNYYLSLKGFVFNGMILNPQTGWWFWCDVKKKREGNRSKVMLIDDCHSNSSLFNSQIFNLEIGEKAHGQVMDGLLFFPRH